MYSFLVSILIGIGVVLPGVSGSAIAILVGIYDKVLIVLNDSGIKPSKKIIILELWLEWLFLVIHFLKYMNITNFK